MQRLENLSGSPNFWNDIHAAMAAVKSEDVYVFVHGYNNTFDQAPRRAGLIAYAAYLRGATIL